jgi:hypothetical protein
MSASRKKKKQASPQRSVKKIQRTQQTVRKQRLDRERELRRQRRSSTSPKTQNLSNAPAKSINTSGQSKQQNSSQRKNNDYFLNHLLNLLSIYETGKLDDKLIHEWRVAFNYYMKKQIIPNIPEKFRGKSPQQINKMSHESKNEYLESLAHIMKFPRTRPSDDHSHVKVKNYLRSKNLSYGLDKINPFLILTNTTTTLNCAGYSFLLGLIVSQLGLYAIIYMITSAPEHMYGMTPLRQIELTGQSCMCHECTRPPFYSERTCATNTHYVAETETMAVQHAYAVIHEWARDFVLSDTTNGDFTKDRLSSLEIYAENTMLNEPIDENSSQLHNMFLDNLLYLRKDEFVEIMLETIFNDNTNKYDLKRLVPDFLVHLLIFISSGAGRQSSRIGDSSSIVFKNIHDLLSVIKRTVGPFRRMPGLDWVLKAFIDLIKQEEYPEQSDLIDLQNILNSLYPYTVRHEFKWRDD